MLKECTRHSAHIYIGAMKKKMTLTLNFENSILSYILYFLKWKCMCDACKRLKDTEEGKGNKGDQALILPVSWCPMRKQYTQIFSLCRLLKITIYFIHA